MSGKLCITTAALLALTAASTAPLDASAQVFGRSDTVLTTLSLECNPHGAYATGTRIVLVNKGHTVPAGTVITITYRAVPVLTGAKVAGATGVATPFPMRVITHTLLKALTSGSPEVLNVEARECLSATYRRPSGVGSPLETVR